MATTFNRIQCPVHDGGDANCSTWYDRRGRLRARCWSHDCPENEILAALGEPPIRKSAAAQARDDARQARADIEANRTLCRGVVKTSDGGLTVIGRTASRPRLEFDGRLLKGPFSLEVLAQAKRLPVEFLRSQCRIGSQRNFGRTTVLIGYYNFDNQLVQVRYRNALVGGDRFRSQRGMKSMVYGEWRLRSDLERSRGELFVVEGESDCWAYWFHGYAALGIPGASCAYLLRRDHLVGVKQIRLQIEPDQGGSAFERGMRRRFYQLGLLK